MSNNSFIDQITFDSMRKHLLQDFSQIYNLDLDGNVRRNPKLSGTIHNVFGFQVGVGITVAVRKSQDATSKLDYYRVPENWRKEEKLSFLIEKNSIMGIDWQELHPDHQHTWLTKEMKPEFATFFPMGIKEAGNTKGGVSVNALTKSFLVGINSSRDSIVYNFSLDMLTHQIKQFIEDYNAEVFRWIAGGRSKDVDNFVHYDKVKWSEHLKNELKGERYAQADSTRFRTAIYRPFCKKWLYYDSTFIEGRPFFCMGRPNHTPKGLCDAPVTRGGSSR